MAKPLFEEQELANFNSRLKEIKNDNVTYPDWNSREVAENSVRNAFLAQTITRIKDRKEDFLNYLTIFVGSKGAKADISLYQGFSLADDPGYLKILKEYDTPLNRRYVHMFFKATSVAYRSWALTAFVKFLRGNKVAGGKANTIEGFGFFHKDSGWSEMEVKRVATHFFDSDSHMAKLFMQYDMKISDRVYDAINKAYENDEEGDDDTKVPYGAQFAATSKIVNKEFIVELMAALEAKELAPLPNNPKKAFKPRVPKIFKVGDIIQKATIADLPPLSIIEIKVKARMKRSEENKPTTIQIVLVSPPQPRFYLKIWRIVDGKAYFPPSGDFYIFDHDRKTLEGATYQGQWEYGVQADKKPYKYPHDYIGV